MITQLTTAQLEVALSEAKLKMDGINWQLKKDKLPEETYRGLVKTKNELTGYIQAVEVELAKRAETYPKQFTRSLNESFEL